MYALFALCFYKGLFFMQQPLPEKNGSGKAMPMQDGVP
jgi:hypothetical protein